MCSVVGFNNSVDSDVSESSESEAAMSNSAQSYIPLPTSFPASSQLPIESSATACGF